MQFSHILQGVLDGRIFLPAPFLSSLISLLMVLYHVEYGCVVVISQQALLDFKQNLPSICSYEPSITMRDGTPSHWNMMDKASWTSSFFFMGRFWSICNLNWIPGYICYHLYWLLKLQHHKLTYFIVISTKLQTKLVYGSIPHLRTNQSLRFDSSSKRMTK